MSAAALAALDAREASAAGPAPRMLAAVREAGLTKDELARAHGIRSFRRV
jgi:hypothetical protein